MKLELIVDEAKFNTQINELIKGKVRNVLRSDKQLTSLIEEVIDREVEKRVNYLFVILDVNEQYITERVDKVLKKLERRATNTITKKVESLLQPNLEEHNRAVLQKLLALHIEKN